MVFVVDARGFLIRSWFQPTDIPYNLASKVACSIELVLSVGWAGLELRRSENKTECQ
jgi:hypothetical protein